MRRARIATTHGDEATAERIAAAVVPDNTAEMETVVEGERVVTTVARETTGGLRSTVDDYVVNCTVAAQLAGEQDRRTDTQTADSDPTDPNTADDQDNP
jgi:hypothetical protein